MTLDPAGLGEAGATAMEEEVSVCAGTAAVWRTQPPGRRS